MLHLYDVGGLLVRRWVPAQRRLTLEVWTGDGWTPYPDAENVSRHGHRITEGRALVMLRSGSGITGAPALDDGQAIMVLHARRRRA